MTKSTGRAVAAYLAETQELALSPARAKEISTIAARLNRVTLEAAMQRSSLDDPARYYAVLAGVLDSKTDVSR